MCDVSLLDLSSQEPLIFHSLWPLSHTEQDPEPRKVKKESQSGLEEMSQGQFFRQDGLNLKGKELAHCFVFPLVEFSAHFYHFGGSLSIAETGTQKKLRKPQTLLWVYFYLFYAKESPRNSTCLTHSHEVHLPGLLWSHLSTMSCLTFYGRGQQLRTQVSVIFLLPLATLKTRPTAQYMVRMVKNIYRYMRVCVRKGITEFS